VNEYSIGCEDKVDFYLITDLKGIKVASRRRRRARPIADNKPANPVMVKPEGPADTVGHKRSSPNKGLPTLAMGRGRIILMMAVFIGLLPVELILLNRVLSSSPGEQVPTAPAVVLPEGPNFHKPYLTIPPTSGARATKTAAWGTHSSPISSELQVANLDEGGVILQYSCNAQTEQCASLVKSLKTIADSYSGKKIIIAPGPGIVDAHISLSAWGRLMKSDTVDTTKIREFIDAYEGLPKEDR